MSQVPTQFLTFVARGLLALFHSTSLRHSAANVTS